MIFQRKPVKILRDISDFADVINEANTRAKEFLETKELSHYPLRTTEWSYDRRYADNLSVRDLILINTILRTRNTTVHLTTRAEYESYLREPFREKYMGGLDSGILPLIRIMSCDSLCLGEFTENQKIETAFSQRLVEILQKRGKRYTLSKLQKKVSKSPLIIPLRDVIMKPKNEGFELVPTEDAEIYFDWKLKEYLFFNVTNKRGIPNSNDRLGRRFTGNSGGLTGVCINYDLNLDASMPYDEFNRERFRLLLTE